MANEAVIVELLGDRGDVIYVTVNNTGGIEKGTLLNLTDPRTGAASATEGEACSGIASAEKVTLDGSVKLGVYTNVIADMYCSGAVVVGAALMSAGVANEVKELSGTNISGAKVIGNALEAGDDQEVIQCRIRL